jgi:hypothetical protein
MTTELIIRPPEVVEGEVVGNGLFLEANPFHIGAFHWVEVKEGATLAEHYEAAAAVLPPAYRPHIELWIEEDRVERAYWRNVTPKPGRMVYARVRPHGGKGGKNILRAFLMIAVIVAATYFLGPAAFAANGWLGGLGLTGFAAAAASAVAIAVVSTVAMLAINALIPAPGLTNDNLNSTPKPTLTGSSNQFAPYAPVPRLFGKLRVSPLLAGYPYTEVVGNKQYLRMLLLVGWGPLKISDIRLGDTPLSSYNNVEIEITEGGPGGWAGNVPITLYNRKVSETQLSIALTSAGGASPGQATGVNVVEISCDITFPFGLIHINKDGTRVARSVAISVQYRPLGGGTWLNAPLETAYADSNQSVSGHTITVTATSNDAVRANARFKVASGQYEVRLQRTTGDASNGTSGDQILDGSYWTTLRSFSTDLPVVQDQVCMIALRMQATDQLNGVPQQVNCIAESYLPVYGIGSELVTSGDGTSASGWTGGGSATPSATGGRLRVTNGGSSNGYAYQSFTVVAGHRYLIQYDKWHGTTTDARVKVGISANDGSLLDESEPGDIPNNSTVVTPAGTSLFITLMAEGVATTYAEFDNISVKDLDANSSWSYQITRSPAWAFADILRRRGGQTFIADARIDLVAISAWNVAAMTKAPNASEPRWTFDGVIEGGTVFEALSTVAACGRAGYTMRDGKFSVIQDKAQSTPVQLITPKNSWGYGGTRTFLDQPHALRVEFINKDLDYQKDERIVYADGYNSSNATLFEVLSIQGCTTPALAFREARYHMAVAALRPEEHRVSMDIEGLRCTRGDRVELAYDVMVVGKTWGRITGLTTSGTDTIGFIVDEDCEIENSVTYQLRVRHSNGTITTRTVTASPGITRTLLCASEATAGGPQIGDVFIFGETGIVSAPMMVKKIEPGEELTVNLVMTNYDPAIYTADTGTIPAFTSFVGSDARKTPPLQPVVSLRADGTTFDLANNTNRIAVDIYTPSGRIVVVGNEVQFRETGDTAWRPVGDLHSVGEVTVYASDGILQGHTYQVRVRAKGANDLYSDWVQPTDIVSAGTSVLPTVPTAASAYSAYHAVILYWTNPADLDFSTVEVLASMTNSSGSATVVGSSANGTFTHSGLFGGQVWYYWLRAVDTAGNHSDLVAVNPGGTVVDDTATGSDNLVPDPNFSGGGSTGGTDFGPAWDGGGKFQLDDQGGGLA